MPQKCVAVAMSGGVDSSVAAAILKEQCYHVIGVSMLLNHDEDDEEIENARQVAERLAIPHHTVDFRQFFKQKVITPFCDEYRRGRTPNPCVVCNHYVKLDALLKKVVEMGADFMATGHYVHIELCGNIYRLFKGVDHNKDQSYFLYTLKQEQLRRLMFPLGRLYKSQIKRMAREMGFNDFLKKESQDVCFIPGNDHHSFISQKVPSTPGDIVDLDGNVLGKHKGLSHYTIGQRQGLGLSADSRLYVIRIDFTNNLLVAGTQEQLFVSQLSASQLNWISGKPPQDLAGITARIRYKAAESNIGTYIDNGTAYIKFAQPQQSAAPGQSIVFYRKDEMLGGGIIEETFQEEEGEQD